MISYYCTDCQVAISTLNTFTAVSDIHISFHHISLDAMPPKSKKTKAEEAADFLSTLDLDVPDETPAPAAAPATRISTDIKRSDSPRASIDSKRSVKSGETARAGSPAPGSSTTTAAAPASDEAQKTLDFLEAQINTKRTPLSVPGPASLRTPSPLSGAAATSSTPANVPTGSVGGQVEQASGEQKGGWGGWWSSASSAIQSAQKIADEGYKKVRTEGVAGLEGVKVGGMDLGTLRKGAEERLKGIQLPQGIHLPQGIDLEKLSMSISSLQILCSRLKRVGSKLMTTGHDLLTNTQSALTQLINTVAPPISAHETLELWLAHPMTGYAGVESVVYKAWTNILEQTESGELVVVWSPPASAEGIEERGINPVDGWTPGWELTLKEIAEIKAREEKAPKGRASQNRTSRYDCLADGSRRSGYHCAYLFVPPARSSSAQHSRAGFVDVG